MVSAQAQQQEQQWAAWMRAAQAGDARAYEQLLRAIAPFLRSLARRYCRDPDRREDVVQEVLLTVHRVRHTWDPGRPFSPWLAAIAARRAIALKPREAQYRINLARLLIALHRDDDAREEIAELRRLGGLGQNDAAANALEKRMARER